MAIHWGTGGIPADRLHDREGSGIGLEGMMTKYRIVREPNCYRRDFEFHVEYRRGWWWPFWSRHGDPFVSEGHAIRMVEDALWASENPPAIVKEW